MPHATHMENSRVWDTDRECYWIYTACRPKEPFLLGYAKYSFTYHPSKVTCQHCRRKLWPTAAGGAKMRHPVDLVTKLERKQ